MQSFNRQADKQIKFCFCQNILNRKEILYRDKIPWETDPLWILMLSDFVKILHAHSVIQD